MTTALAAPRPLARVLAHLRTEAGLFVLGLLVIAVHVLDDSFVQPNAGTSASDHLVGGLVPLGVLGLAAWAYPRLRGGRRGALALVFGALGASTGLEAFQYTREVGASGDDYTGLLALAAGLLLVALGVVTLWRTRRLDGGLLALAAGLLLVALGAVTLWRTRRLDGGLPWRYVRRALLVVAGFLVFMTFVFPVALSYVSTHVGRAVVPAPHLGAAHEPVRFTTSDGLELSGWYVASRNGAAVIAFPGRKGPQRQTRMLVRHGYGVLLFDRRGEGESQGDPHAFGWGGEKDIHAAIAFLKDRPDVEPGRIGGIGLSVGGELMLEAAAENRDLAAVVSEGAGARVASEELSDLSGIEKWTAVPNYVTQTAALAVFSNQAPPTDLSKLIPRIAPRPVFLIHAAHGEVGNKTPEYLAAAGEPKQSWTVPKGGHTGGIDAMPEEYERRVIGFLDAALR